MIILENEVTDQRLLQASVTAESQLKLEQIDDGQNWKEARREPA
jgi:hypothetical protein